MYHLPAYVALERWLLQKRVAVVLPAGPEGPRRLAAAGAARVLVVGGECPAEPGVEVCPGQLQPGHLPLRDASVDAVTCLDSFAGLTAESRHLLVGEARRILRSGGVLAVGAPGEPDALWQVEDELRTAFPHVAAFAQLAWQGVSLAPVLATAPSGALGAALREGLLREPLPAQRYVLLASSEALDEPLRECVIVPLGPADGVVRVDPQDEVIRAASTEEAGGYAFPTAADAANELPPAPRPAAAPEPAVDVADLDDLFAAPAAPPPPAPVAPPPAAVAPRLALTLDPATQAQLELLRAQVAELSREREGLVNHAAKMASELERSREEKARTEAELYAARLRVEVLQRVPEDSRLMPVGMLARHPDMVPEPEAALPAHELVEEVASLVAPESGRATADAALDRNRLREELARRTAELQELETRVLQQEEELRREHLENVRLVTDVDRLREQVERSRAIEQERVQELERLGHELRKLEMAHAELQGLFNTQEQRLRDLEDAGMGVNTVDNSADAMALRELLHQAIGERDQARARERAGGELVRRRDRELAEAQRTLRELRRAVEEHASVAANLRGELAVLQVQVERLEETVPTLQERLREQQRKTLDRDEEAAELQRRLEEAVSEQEHLRGRLRRHKQEMDALAAAKQGAEVELFRLRRELEAKHQAIEQLQQIVALGTGRVGQFGEGAMSEAGVAEVMRLRAMMADQAAEHAEALARSEAEHQRINEVERSRLRRARLESGIRAEEMEFLLFQLDTAEQRIWEMNDAADRAAARLAAGLAQLQKQKEQHEDLVDELEVTRNLLVEAQAKVAELERLLDSERARLARVSLAPTEAAVETGEAAFDVTVDEDAAEVIEVDPEPGDSMTAPVIQRHPDEPDPLAGIDFDDDGPQESLAARLAGSRHAEESSEIDLASALASAEVSSPSFSLPSDHDVDLDEDDDDLADLTNLPTRPRAYAAPPEEEDEEVFAIDTEGWIDDEDLGGPPQRPQTRPKFDTRHEGRIVIEVLDDEAWPDDAGDGGAKLPS